MAQDFFSFLFCFSRENSSRPSEEKEGGRGRKNKKREEEEQKENEEIGRVKTSRPTSQLRRDGRWAAGARWVALALARVDFGTALVRLELEFGSVWPLLGGLSLHLARLGSARRRPLAPQLRLHRAAPRRPVKTFRNMQMSRLRTRQEKGKWRNARKEIREEKKNRSQPFPPTLSISNQTALVPSLI